MWGDEFDPNDHESKISIADQEQFCPSVDVYLPVCGEPTHLLDNTWKHVRALDYPNIAVHVLDDGAKEEVRVLAALYGFNCKYTGDEGYAPINCSRNGMNGWLQRLLVRRQRCRRLSATRECYEYLGLCLGATPLSAMKKYRLLRFFFRNATY